MRSRGQNGQSFESAVPVDAFVARDQWKASASSFQNGEGTPSNVFDGDETTFWHSRYSPEKTELPQWISVDMATQQKIKAVLLTPRADGSNGRIGDYELYLSDDPDNFGAPVVTGTLASEGTQQRIDLPAPQSARYLKIVVKSERSGQSLATLAELNIVPAG